MKVKKAPSEWRGSWIYRSLNMAVSCGGTIGVVSPTPRIKWSAAAAADMLQAVCPCYAVLSYAKYPS